MMRKSAASRGPLPSCESDRTTTSRGVDDAVDANGTERVRIAAPLPDPIKIGKPFDRQGLVSGMLIFDPAMQAPTDTIV